MDSKRRRDKAGEEGGAVEDDGLKAGDGTPTPGRGQTQKDTDQDQRGESQNQRPPVKRLKMTAITPDHSAPKQILASYYSKHFIFPLFKPEEHLPPHAINPSVASLVGCSIRRTSISSLPSQDIVLETTDHKTIIIKVDADKRDGYVIVIQNTLFNALREASFQRPIEVKQVVMAQPEVMVTEVTGIVKQLYGHISENPIVLGMRVEGMEGLGWMWGEKIDEDVEKEKLEEWEQRECLIPNKYCDVKVQVIK